MSSLGTRYIPEMSSLGTRYIPEMSSLGTRNGPEMSSHQQRRISLVLCNTIFTYTDSYSIEYSG